MPEVHQAIAKMVLAVTCGVYLVGYLTSWGLGRRFSALGDIVVSALLGALPVFIILSPRFDADSKKWAYGTVGLIAGHWMGRKSM
ncbi:MAG: hypothetical protein ACLP6G_16935 [Terriglobales bacterium]